MELLFREIASICNSHFFLDIIVCCTSIITKLYRMLLFCVLQLFVIGRHFFVSFLVTVMGLVIPWSLVLVLVDAYSVFVKSLDLQRRNLLMIIIGDLVLSFLSLAAACSTASVADLLLDVGRSFCPAKLCSRFQLSAAMAFLSWFLSFSSSLFNLWLLPSL
ncbi:CASP-LIKE PROTEIN 5C1 [Salix viminalis]|uniref:CASP-like protein n=1 Tax=Salix viminalis TaxID=40686 RepID=A0A9Q0NZA8_SALVM|nr:CASP-LIKE PROTEIN 5C1 [Salix viminalis]KAJ6678525.1 CASP-LIKE PROTEIN 5C1 [Salix viminalis]